MATAEKTKLQNFIGGEFVNPADGAYEDVINPATTEVIAEAPLSGEEDVDRAVAAARGAFETWGGSPPPPPAPRPCSPSPTRSRSTPRSSRTSRQPTPGSRAEPSSPTRCPPWPTSFASSPAPLAAWRARPRAST